MGTNCTNCNCAKEDESSQLTNLTFSISKGKRKANHSSQDLDTKYLKEFLFIQREIKKFLHRKKEKRDPYSRFRHNPNPSISKKNNLNDISTSNEEFINKDLKYVENLQINNAIYTGEILNGKRHGKGTQIWDDGAKYEGSWVNDQASGYGIFYHKDGDVYKGYWENDKANGEGVFISSEGGRSEGFWVDDVQNGYGTEQWKDGSSYKGNFNMGKKEGFGEYTWPDGRKYTGNWVDNKLEGKGSYYYPDGREYIGDFKDNMLEGKGKFIYSDKKVYIGMFKGGKKEGLGKFCWNDGKEYIGFWKMNKQEGLGKYINPKENSIQFGIWKNGKRTKFLDDAEINEKMNNNDEQYNMICDFDKIFLQ